FDSRDLLDHFMQSLQAVIDRHDILRTAVQWEGLAEPLQVVWRSAPLAVEEVVLDAAAGDIGEQLRERVEARAYRLDVRLAPMIRALVAHDEQSGRWVLLCLYHHLVVDHTTMDIVQREVGAQMAGQPLPPTYPFRNFVAQARLGVSREEHQAFFTGMLGDVDEATAPFGLIDVHGDGVGIEETSQMLEAGLARRLRERARALNVSTASLCHLAWARVLAKISGRSDVVFGTVMFGRMQGGEGADRALGMFINTLPLRIRIDGTGVGDGVRDVHALMAQLLRHEHASLTLAQRCSAVAAPMPLFGTLLNYRHLSAPDDGPVSGEVAHEAAGMEVLGAQERTNYPLTLSVDDLGDGFGLTAQVQSPIDAGQVCRYMHTALASLVQALEQAPSTP
ncbi:condensation domain-containing protein, partial [Herbaspirillum sp. GCM10030257]|uniref:condensation domain-containing protein n=1 Tax=Herbaspirillum sp. GCM10030257 TaxID=3273393 RepID=UPI00361580BC